MAKPQQFMPITQHSAIKYDGRCWHLRYQTGTSEAGLPTFDVTYHTNLEQVSKTALSRDALTCESLDQLLSYYKSAVVALTAYMEDKTNV